MHSINYYDGMFPALLTPFCKDESINHLELKNMVNYLEKFDFRGFYVGGSTGEGMLMSSEERKSIFKTVINSIQNDKLLLVAHIGSPSTFQAIDMGLYAKSQGYGAISAVAPYYYSFKLSEIKEYYKTISSKVGLPFIIYNFPGASNYSLDTETVKDLFSDKNFIGIKHTSYDLYSLSKFREAEKDISIYNGFDEVLLAGLSMGASGGIGSTYNIMPKLILKIYQEFLKGNLQTAKDCQEKANKIISILIKCGVMPAEKYLLGKSGIDMGNCRHPFAPLTKESKILLDSIDLDF